MIICSFFLLFLSMRWLHNISLSSHSLSSSSCLRSPKWSSSSSAMEDTDSHDKAVNLLAIGSSNGVKDGPKLTRARKLRHLTDKDVGIVPTKSAPQDHAESLGVSRSQSVPVAVPLPLPLPVVREDSSYADGELRLVSLKEKERDGHRDRDREMGRRPRDRLEGGDAVCSLFAVPNRRKAAGENPEPRLSTFSQPELSTADKNFGGNVPIRSAPSSPFASPMRSPQMTSNAADLLPYYQKMAKNQVWSAPEMTALDIPGLPPPAFFAFSADNSPFHSPRNKSPLRNPRSPTVPFRLSVDSATSRYESNANIEVHPLPLPPGAALPSPSAAGPQLLVKPESSSMKIQWQKGKLIGRGTFGSVYVASNRETGALCAMKEVEMFPDDPKSAECIKQLQQEIKVLSRLKHPNIVQYYGSDIIGDHFYIYLEYVHPGSINKYVREHCGAITENVVRSFTRHILSGLAYLHSMKTIHRDIKGANLLVDASGVVKLADFGTAKHLSGQAAELSLKGSPYWMAPELMQAVMQKDNSSDLALAVDIWSLGCTIIEMLTGKPPWCEFEGAAAMFRVLKETPPVPDTLSPDGKDFLSCCFQRNPAERPSASMLLEHRWIRSQNLDVSSSNQLISGIKLTDPTLHSPRTSDVRYDQLTLFQNPQSTRGKVAPDSFMQHSFSTSRQTDHSLRLPT